jgi:hypothetical protein
MVPSPLISLIFENQKGGFKMRIDTDTIWPGRIDFMNDDNNVYVQIYRDWSSSISFDYKAFKKQINSYQGNGRLHNMLHIPDGYVGRLVDSNSLESTLQSFKAIADKYDIDIDDFLEEIRSYYLERRRA